MGIHILDERTINKIAAGEVVENPAAVVKELAENSIDAGASSITIEIENGGVKKIRVTDNGFGIDASEVQLAFTRHATSKITDARDLSNISSLGFRGEALASIAAVSMTHIATKTRTTDMGCEVQISGGKVEGIKAAGLPNGTTMIVNNLFFNTPARLKFLKGAPQEAAAVTDTVAKLILSHPGISFRYISNSETIYHSSGSGKIIDAMVCVYGRDILQKTAHVEYTYDKIHVYGFIGMPQYAKKNRRSQVFIVNGRIVKSDILSYHVLKSYSQRILKGHYPYILLYIDLAYGFTDVNVHPNKLTIRFNDEQKIAYVLQEAVNMALSTKPLTGYIKTNEPLEESLKQIDTADDRTAVKTEILNNEPIKPRAVEKEDVAAVSYEDLSIKQSLQQQTVFFTQAKDTDKKLKSDNGMFYDVLQSIQTKENEREEEDREEAQSAEKEPFWTQYRVLGQLFNSYILIECADKLLLIDQHAAHERALYDEATEAFRREENLSIPLLMPEIIQVSHAEKLLIDEYRQSFFDIGFDMEEFGSLTYRVSAIPYLFNQSDLTGIMDDMFGELKRNPGEKPLIRVQNMIRAACKKAVKANMPLSGEEIEKIVTGYIEHAAMPTCPHGRPIVTVITKTEIEKGFKRIV
jgi:DNA mismatch repair protein MutL